MRLPKPRGVLSEWVMARLAGTEVPGAAPAADSPEDEAVSLWTLHELAYLGFEDVRLDVDGDPDVLVVRHRLEAALEERLRSRWTGSDAGPVDVPAALEALVAADDGPSLADHVRRHADREQVLELLRQRSVYHLKEADPQSWAVPRLSGAAKAAFVTVQHDEYGAGRGERMHAALFAAMMRELDLDDAYGAYSGAAPAVTLAPVNLMSMTGLHRSLLGAAVGHFVMVEVTSSPGSRRLSSAFRRLGAGEAGQRFYDEHVEADAVHEQVLRRDLLGDLLTRSPQLAADVVLGVQASLLLEGRFGDHLLAQWEQGRSVTGL